MIQSIRDALSVMTEEELGIAEYTALSSAKGSFWWWNVIHSKGGTKEGNRIDSNNDQQTE